MKSPPKPGKPKIPNPAVQASDEQTSRTSLALYAPPSLVSQPSFIRRASTQKRQLVGGGGSA